MLPKDLSFSDRCKYGQMGVCSGLINEGLIVYFSDGRKYGQRGVCGGLINEGIIVYF